MKQKSLCRRSKAGLSCFYPWMWMLLLWLGGSLPSVAAGQWKDTIVVPREFDALLHLRKVVDAPQHLQQCRLGRLHPH